jgi:hypothetical protein
MITETYSNNKQLVKTSNIFQKQPTIRHKIPKVKILLIIIRHLIVEFILELNLP